ncbi:MAG: hypothetical protein SWQ30_12770 [Thermodesulfobacteriota bacterium]|nr:hypothetical protein [Thermodesulfobacteriota bacterium]
MAYERVFWGIRGFALDNNWDEVESRIREAIPENPRDPRFWLLLADFLEIVRCNPEEAASCRAKALNIESNDNSTSFVRRFKLRNSIVSDLLVHAVLFEPSLRIDHDAAEEGLWLSVHFTGQHVPSLVQLARLQWTVRRNLVAADQLYSLASRLDPDNPVIKAEYSQFLKDKAT